MFRSNRIGSARQKSFRSGSADHESKGKTIQTTSRLLSNHNEINRNNRQQQILRENFFIASKLINTQGGKNLQKKLLEEQFIE